MRRKTGPFLLSTLAAGLVLWGSVVTGMAAETKPLQDATAVPGQEEPALSFPAEGSYFLGYRWFSSKDSLRAARYIYPRSSVNFGLDLLSCPLPYRYHAHAEYLGAYDFYADGGFAYKDLFLFRDILVGARHNLPHLDYGFSGEPPDLVFSDRNPGDDYYLDFMSNLLTMRLKAPDFPLHGFLHHRHIRRDGNIQQRFLLGDYESLELVSRSREIEWRSNALELGLNSHFGPVEIEYAYDRARFDPGRNHILHDSYPQSIIFNRPADLYAHNVVPEIEVSGHTMKFHSSYTGGIVAAATLGTLSEKNNYSSTEATTRKGAFDLRWIPRPAVGVFFKYRHRSVDLEAPDETALTGLSNTVLYPVRTGISHNRDSFSLATRYRPLRLLTLLGTYEFTHISRKNVDEWPVLPGHTNVHRINLAAHASPLADVKTRAVYEYRNYIQPAYNSSPDHSSTLRLTTTYSPAPRLNLHLEYLVAVTERNGLRFINSDLSLLELGERSGRRDKFLATLSAAISPKATMAATWFYERWKVKQDLTFRRLAAIGDPLYFIDFAVPYTDEANSFSLAFHYTPRQDISISADATHTIAEGATGFHDVVGGAPFSLASFSDLKISETNFSLGVFKKVSRAWEMGLRSHLGIHNDRVHDLADGKVFTTTLRLKRYF